MSDRRSPERDPMDEILRRWMQDGAPAAAPERILAGVRTSAMRTPQQQARPGWYLGLGLSAIATAVAAMVVVFGLTRPVGQNVPGITPSPPVSTVPSSGAATGSASAASASPTPFAEPWTRAEVEHPAENSSVMNGVANGPGGYVAVGGGGSVEGFGGVLAWHSTDGLSWTLTLDAHAQQDGSQMRDVIATDDGYVGVGNHVQGVPVWVSADGLAWLEADATAAPAGSSHSLVAIDGGDAGLVIIGFTSENDAQVATAWSSGDGAAWTRTEAPDAYASAWPVDVALADDGIGVIVGMTQPGGGAPVAWFVDGELIGEPIVLPSADPDAMVDAVVATPGGFTAVGHGWDPAESAYRLLAWRSIDGRSWQEVEVDGIGLPLGAAQIDGRGVVAVGATMGLEESDVAAWQLSVDGAWQAFAVEASNGAGHAVLGRPDGRLMVVGATDPDGEAMVWIGP